MNELLKCKVRSIKDSSGRWEIRLEQQILPAVLVELAGNTIKIKFPEGDFVAYTGIAAKDKPHQYFWINTHKDEAGPIKNILEAHGYKPNDEIILSLDRASHVAHVRTAYLFSRNRGHRHKERDHTKTQLKLNDPREARLHNIIDMGLDFSAMIRLFDKGSKKKFRARIISEVRRVFEAESQKRFNEIHTNFSNWGMDNIMLAEKRKNGQILQRTAPASYGQIAKTLDVVLKVTVYYCHLPDCEKSRLISAWLNAAVDTKMMAFLKRCYPEDMRPWPTNIKQVNSSDYTAIQKLVRKFINERHNGSITPVQFDDIYWEALNRKESSPADK